MALMCEVNHEFVHKINNNSNKISELIKIQENNKWGGVKAQNLVADFLLRKDTPTINFDMLNYLLINVPII